MKLITRRPWIALALVPVVTFLAFQNCAPFHTADIAGLSTAASLGDITNTVDTSVARSFAATEWQPIEVNLPTGWTAANAPAGSYVDTTSNTFRWIPGAGQAGNYTIHLANAAGAPSGDLTLSIAALATGRLARGPADGTSDGDVGFVFVHGMSNEDYCASSNANDLTSYWGNTPTIIARAVAPRKVACYDGRAAVEAVAPSVAQQILDADCGKFHRCIIVTHSMGGLVLEFMMDHARLPTATDGDATLFNSNGLYAAAKKKILAVVSIASAAGGSGAASILASSSRTYAQTLAASYLTEYDVKSASFASLAVSRAAGALAPIAADPGVPFFMVPGFTAKNSGEAGITMVSAFTASLPNDLYQADPIYAALDPAIALPSRSDGLIEFRSSCGIASDRAADGPGYTAALATHLSYCYQSAKKPNHAVWFVTDLNHDLNKTTWSLCTNSATLCHIYDPDVNQSTFTANSTFDGLSAVEAIRAKLDVNRSLTGMPVIGTYAQ